MSIIYTGIIESGCYMQVRHRYGEKRVSEKIQNFTKYERVGKRKKLKHGFKIRYLMNERGKS